MKWWLMTIFLFAKNNRGDFFISIYNFWNTKALIFSKYNTSLKVQRKISESTINIAYHIVILTISIIQFCLNSFIYLHFASCIIVFLKWRPWRFIVVFKRVKRLFIVSILAHYILRSNQFTKKKHLKNNSNKPFP